MSQLEDPEALAKRIYPLWGRTLIADAAAAIRTRDEQWRTNTPSVEMRLAMYRQGALAALAGTTVADGGKSSEQRLGEAIERIAHAMLKAERTP